MSSKCSTCKLHFNISVCWQCSKQVTGTCELHGPLLPCTEIVTERGRKDPAKFPVPSFVEIRESDIPGAGNGVFATKFIEPGQIVGESYSDSYLLFNR